MTVHQITHIVRPEIHPFRKRKEYSTTWCNKQLLWTQPSRTIDMALSALDDDVAGMFPTCTDCLAAVYAAIGEYLSGATSGTDDEVPA